MRLGGTAAINQLVNGMYHKIWKDPALKEFYSAKEKEVNKERMKRYLIFLTGGSTVWTGRLLNDAHQGQGMHQEHFDLILKHILSTLKDMKVDQAISKDM